MKSTELLLQDHTLLRRALDVLDAMINSMERSERIEVADAATIIKFIGTFGREYHQAIEESIVYPALLGDATLDTSIRNLFFEHEEIQSLISGIDEALKSRKGIDFVRKSRGLIVLFRNHLEREDDIVRSKDDSWLSKDEDDAILASIMQLRNHPWNFASLAALEWKYASKAFGTINPQRPLHRAQGSAAH